MSDFGMFESDEVTQSNPRVAAKTAGLKLEAALDEVRAKFGRFLIGATGIDEFGDRWHYSKADIRATVEPYVFPNTGTMRRIQNAMKQDWKLAHPYKLAIDHDDAGFGSMPTGDSRRNQDLDETYRPSSGNLIPEGNFEGYKDSVDQGGPEKVESNDFTPGGDSGSDRHASINREAAALVADIYADFAHSNGLRVASFGTLDHYASTGIAEADYRLLESMIITAKGCDCESDDCSCGDDEGEESEDHAEPDADNAGGPSDYDEDNEDDDESDDEDSDDDYSDTDFDGDHDDDDHHDGGGDVSQTFTVPQEAPDLDPQMLNEIPHDDPQGAAPVPPEVIDSLLGLPEGTIEQLLLEEVEQGQGGSDGYGGPPQGGGDQFGGAPQGGGDDFLGEAGDDAEQGPPPRQARRCHAGDDFNPEHGFNGIITNDDHPRYRKPKPSWDEAFEEARSLGMDHGEAGEYAQSVAGRKASRRRQAAPDESESSMMGRQRSQQRDAIDTKFGPRRDTSKPDIQDLYKRARNGDPTAYAQLRAVWNQRGWTASKAARMFWAAEDDQEQPAGGGDPAAGQQGSPQGDPTGGMGGMDPSMMGQGGGMLPPPGSQAVQPPQPPQPLEDQPAEDALLDTANQAIMQMIDRETQEYQQIIDPLSQALQAIQFAQQVEQSEHPMDVTPPQGTVNVDPSQAPGGAGNPMQQQASRRQAGHPEEDEDYWPHSNAPDHVRTRKELNENNRRIEQEMAQDGWRGKPTPDMPERFPSSREAKKIGALKNAARLIAGRYGLSHGGERMLIQAMSRRNYEHVREALQLLPPEHLQAPQYRAAVRHIGEMFAADNPRFSRDAWMKSVLGSASGSRLPFDSARRTAGENNLPTPTLDAFEWEGDKPRIDDNIAMSDLPKMKGASRAEDAVSRFQRWTQWRQQNGLVVPGGDGGIHTFMQKTRNPGKPKIGEEASDILHRSMGYEPDAPKQNKPRVQKAVNPTLKKPKAPKAAKFVNEDGGYHTRDDDDPDHVFVNPRNGEKYVVQHEDGTLFRPGEKLEGSRGDPYHLKGISKYPEGPSGGKLHVDDGDGSREFYPSVFDAEIVPYTKDWDPDEGQDPFDPRLIGASWGEWEPPKTASFFTRRVPGWKWDDHLSGYISKEAKAFTCSCGQKIAAPSYRSCDCGKIWNVYAIGDQHHLGSNTADMFIAREIPVRDNVIMANRKMAGEGGRGLAGDWMDFANAGGVDLTDFRNRYNPSDEDMTRLQRYLDNKGLPKEKPRWNADPDEHLDPFDPRIIGAGRKTAGTFDDFFEWGDEFNKNFGRAFGVGDEDSPYDDDDHDYDPTKDPKSFTYEDPNLAQDYCADCDGELGKHGVSMPLTYPHTGEKLCENCMDSRIDEEMDIHVPKDWDPDGIDLDGDDPRIKGASKTAGWGDWENIRKPDDDPFPSMENYRSHEDDEDEEFARKKHDLGSYYPEKFMHAAKGDCTCWKGYERVPGTKPCAEGSCRKCDSHRKESRTRSHAELLAMIDKLADWTKYDDDVDPVAETYGKSKIPSTKAPKIPRDWSRREPDGKWKNTNFAPKKK